MKVKLLLLLLPMLGLLSTANGQCTTTNGTSCVCENGSTDCDLLPDITISWYALQTYSGGPTEYPQTGAGADNGRLRVTGSTPNIGYGPFTVEAENPPGTHMFVCGTDTFSGPANSTFVCPNGYPTPKQILWQRIYHKSGNTMQYSDRIAGAMTYEQGGMHVDDWGIMTLRIQNPNEPDPRKWSLLGTGHKQSFCLMDYGSCTTYNGHCRDDNTVYNQGTTLLNGNFPNWGLGNNYGCSSVEQGCSVGYTDIYSESLNGMWIDIPANTCNGTYWIVYEIDPHDYFRESNETNNYTAIPFTLTQQTAPGNPVATITSSSNPLVCGNDSITLTATAGSIYAWSNGATTQSINATAGTYTVTVTNYCGTSTSAPYVITGIAQPAQPNATDTTICNGYSANFNVSGNDVSWYDAGYNLIASGNSFTTPILTATQQYYVTDRNHHAGALANVGKSDSLGTGGYFTGNNYLIFDVLKTLKLKSVKVYASGAGDRTIQLVNSSGTMLQSGIFNIPNGESRVNVNFDIQPGVGYQLRVPGVANLWRNNNSVVYPYTITDTLSITGSSAGATYYYFFYDWEVEVGGGECESAPKLVTVTVQPCVGIDPVSDLSHNISVAPNPSLGRFNVEIIMPGAGEDINLSVVDMLGKIVYSRELKNISGTYVHELEMSNMTEGVYYLTTVIGQRKYVKKIVKL